LDTTFDIIIIGGGAAGFFTAINIAEKHPQKKIAILERGKEVLTKVKISGGGRCNLTHACFDPKEFVKNYPRGEKELLGPFHQFCATETIEWFKRHGVLLKAEKDGRMFPKSDSSQTIIDCFLKASENLGIKVKMQEEVISIDKEKDLWKIETRNEIYLSEKVVITTGSAPPIWKALEKLGHRIIPPVPSLFTFNITDDRIDGLQGLSTEVSLKIDGTKLSSEGPLLITHWGLSGPVILKLSSWGARILAEKDYKFSLSINWLKEMNNEKAKEILQETREKKPKKTILKNNPFPLPTRLWEKLVLASKISEEKKWADISKQEIKDLINQLTNAYFQVEGKSIFKDEFVTAGGTDLKEVDFKDMQSKVHKNLYFAGEVLNIDAITGGFNFQNAWTNGFLVAEGMD
jgi:predicted Rossmann fold flavoprotein